MILNIFNSVLSQFFLSQIFIFKKRKHNKKYWLYIHFLYKKKQKWQYLPKFNKKSNSIIILPYIYPLNMWSIFIIYIHNFPIIISHFYLNIFLLYNIISYIKTHFSFGLKSAIFFFLKKLHQKISRHQITVY